MWYNSGSYKGSVGWPLGCIVSRWSFTVLLISVIASAAKQSHGFVLYRRDCFAALAMTVNKEAFILVKTRNVPTRLWRSRNIAKKGETRCTLDLALGVLFNILNKLGYGKRFWNKPITTRLIALFYLITTFRTLFDVS